MNRYIGIVSLLLILLCGCSHHPQTEISSPDGTIKIYFCLNDSNRMAYRISINDSSFIAPSQLGFEANNGINLYKDFQITGTDFSTKDEVWTQPWGENKSIRNHYNEVAIHLKDSKATRLTTRFRTFDEWFGWSQLS